MGERRFVPGKKLSFVPAVRWSRSILNAQIEPIRAQLKSLSILSQANHDFYSAHASELVLHVRKTWSCWDCICFDYSWIWQGSCLIIGYSVNTRDTVHLMELHESHIRCSLAEFLSARYSVQVVRNMTWPTNSSTTTRFKHWLVWNELMGEYSKLKILTHLHAGHRTRLLDIISWMERSHLCIFNQGLAWTILY